MVTALYLAKLLIEKLSDTLGLDFEPSDCYAGITDDIERHKGEHRADKSLCFYSMDCKTVQRAREVEKILSSQGFDVGDKPANGGNDESHFIYVYLKNPYTIEDTNA